MRPNNPDAWVNRIEGRKVPPLPHTIADISLRDDRAPSDPNKKNELTCACGIHYEAATVDGLHEAYAHHTGKRTTK